MSALLANAGIVTGVVFLALGIVLVLVAMVRRAPNVSRDRVADAPMTPKGGQTMQQPTRPSTPAPATALSPAPSASAVPPPASSTPVTVSLREVIGELVEVGEEETTFLDRTTGEFVTLPDDLRYALENDEPVEDPGKFGFEQLQSIREKMQSKELVELPTKFEIKEFTVRERFVEGLPPGDQKDQMLKALRGQTAFRSFEGAVKRLGLLDDWELARDVELARVALPWLERNDLEFAHDVPGVDQAEAALRKTG